VTTPVNLNKARKAATKAAAKVRADHNVAKHGVTKEARALEKARAQKAARLLDGHKRER